MSAAADSLRPTSLSSTSMPASTTSSTTTRAILPGRKITVYEGGKPPIGTLAKVFEVAAKKFRFTSDNKDLIFSSDLSSRKITQVEADELADKAVEMCKKNKGLTGHLLSAVGTYAKENMELLIKALQAKGLIAKKEDKSSPVLQRLNELYGNDKGETAIREGYLVIKNVGVDVDDEDEDEEASLDGSRPASPRLEHRSSFLGFPDEDENQSRSSTRLTCPSRWHVQEEEENAEEESPRPLRHHYHIHHAAPQEKEAMVGRSNSPPLPTQQERSMPFFSGFSSEDENESRSSTRLTSTSSCHVQVVEDEEDSDEHVSRAGPQMEARVVRSISPPPSAVQQSARPEDLLGNSSQTAAPTHHSYSLNTMLDTPQAAVMRPRNDGDENHRLPLAAASGMSSASVTPLYRVPDPADYSRLLAEESRLRSSMFTKQEASTL